MNKNEMFNNNKGLVWKVIRNMKLYATKDMDMEDYFQIGAMGLLKAIDTYKEGRSSFSNYAFCCIKNELRHHFQDINTNHYKINQETCSYNIEIRNSDDGKIEIIDSVVDYSSLEAFKGIGGVTLGEAIQTLSEDEYAFFQARYLEAEFDDEITKSRSYTIKKLGLSGVGEFKSLDRQVRMKLANALGVKGYDPKHKSTGNIVDNLLK